MELQIPKCMVQRLTELNLKSVFSRYLTILVTLILYCPGGFAQVHGLEMRPIHPGQCDAALVSTLPPPERANAVEYLIFDPASRAFLVEARLKEGSLLLNLYLREGTRRSTIRGSEAFAAIVEHFAGKFHTIVGNWISGDNLDEINRLTTKGFSLEKAASQTWTGIQAEKFGFKRVLIERAEGPPGNYSRVLVYFTRDEQ